MGRALEDASLLPRIIPSKLLSRLVPGHHGREFSASLYECVGSTAVAWTLQQRAERCLTYALADDRIRLQKEQCNQGYENWIFINKPELISCFDRRRLKLRQE